MTEYKTILPKFGSIGKSSKCRPSSVSCSIESNASIVLINKLKGITYYNYIHIELVTTFNKCTDLLIFAGNGGFNDLLRKSSIIIFEVDNNRI
jgi:hypothetical protein